MVGPVLDGALAGDNGLDVEAEHGEHGKAPVLDLLDLELGEGLGVISKAQGVEVVATGVVLVEVLAEGTAVHTVALNAAHEEDLEAEDGEDGLGMDEGGVAEVVKAALGEDLATSLEPDGVAELNACFTQQQTGSGIQDLNDTTNTVAGS